MDILELFDINRMVASGAILLSNQSHALYTDKQKITIVNQYLALANHSICGRFNITFDMHWTHYLYLS